MKRYKKLSLSILILFFLISFFPLKAYASSSNDINITQFDINTLIDNDGYIHMEELITFNFDGEFNGAYIDISTKNTDGIENIKVSLLSNGAATPFTQTSNAKNGDNKVYEILNQGNDLHRIKMYCPSDDEKKTFKITYTMKNVAVKYNDIGEFYYNYWSDDNETEINNMNIHIAFQQNAGNPNIKAFYHGILTGKCEVNDNAIDYSFSGIGSKQLVQTRVIFPVDLISSSNNIKNEDALPRISNEENNYEKSRQEKLAFNAEVRKVLNIISILVSLLLVFIMLRTTSKHRKEAENIYANKDAYNTYSPPEIPEDCTPAVAAYFTLRTVNGRTIYATLLDLWRKGFLTIEKKATESKIKEDEFDFLIVKKKDADSTLLAHEKYFMHWIFDLMGNVDDVRISQIKKACKKSSSYQNYYGWIKLIKEEIKHRNYYDSEANNAGVFEIITAVLIIIFSIISIALNAFYGSAALIAAIALIVHGIVYASKKSEYGKTQYKNWQTFKMYIKCLKADFSNTVEMNTIETYIPYAEALNLDNKYILTLNNAFTNPSENMGWIYYYLIFDNVMLNKNMMFSHYVYTSFSTGNSGTTGTFSGGGTGGGSAAGGGGAGGF